MIKLVVTDLDGTFLNNESSFDLELFREVYAQMQQQGIEFVACTGKQCERVEKLFEHAGEGIWILGDSATRIKKDGQLIREFILERERALHAIRLIEQFDAELTLIACTSGAAYVKDTISPDLYRVVKGSYQEVIKIGSFTEITEEFLKLTVFDPLQRSAALRAYVESELLDTIYIIDSEPRWLDITALHTHKGETVKRLQELLHVTYEQTMAFGDGENDVELMDIAKYSFAVSNACDNTKRAADWITKSNEEKGVLLTIQKMIQLQSATVPAVK